MTGTRVKAEKMKADVIPLPARMKSGRGRFVFEANATISAEALFLPVAKYFSDILASAMGFQIKVRELEATSCIRFSTGDASLGDEGYELDVQLDRILIRAANPAGAFYACQTLRQLLPAEISPELQSKSTAAECRGLPALGGAIGDQGYNKSNSVAAALCCRFPSQKNLPRYNFPRQPDGKGDWSVPCLSIQDKPRFTWRGMMLDPARQFLTKDFIKRYIDILAYYKMNRLHLHLTDNEAWTIEIKKYPQLTEMDRWIWQADVQRSRGVYSQNDIREIVAYAASRYVVVVPEIEMPAHSLNSQLAMRDLLCPNNPWLKARPDWKQWPELEPSCTTWPDRNLIAAEYCMGSEKTFEFFENVLTEVMDLFPSPWIHIGGDEYLGNTWSHCPLCQKRQATLSHEDSPEIAELHRNSKGDPRKYLLYRYGMRRIAEFVVAKGRVPVMWDTLAWHGKYPDGVVVHQWHSCDEPDDYEQTEVPGNPIVEAVENGHDVINSSCSHLYFDYDIVKTPLTKVYEYDPVPDQLPEEKRKHILGAHSPVWGQRQENVDRQAFPRLLAVAEINWSPHAMRNLADFQGRLTRHKARLEDLGIII